MRIQVFTDPFFTDGRKGISENPYSHIFYAVSFSLEQLR